MTSTMRKKKKKTSSCPGQLINQIAAMDLLEGAVPLIAIAVLFPCLRSRRCRSRFLIKLYFLSIVLITQSKTNQRSAAGPRRVQRHGSKRRWRGATWVGLRVRRGGPPGGLFPIPIFPCCLLMLSLAERLLRTKICRVVPQSNNPEAELLCNVCPGNLNPASRPLGGPAGAARW